VPGCYKEQIDQVRATYFPDEHQYTYKAHSISRLIIGRRVLYLGGIPAAIILFWAWMQANPILPVWAIVWILFVFITSKVFHEKWKIFIHEEGILTQSGIFSTKFTLLKWYKIQAINTRQSIYQRRKDVADLYFYTAAGSVKIPYLPLEMAKAISNYALYKVETDERDWM
jgi:putative membrane protein